MNFHNIAYFIAIAEENNISKAAERLHVSQQSLSEQLKKLEQELGTALFVRGHPMVLTAAGRTFWESASEMMATYNSMLEEIAAISKKDREKIVLAIPTTDTPPFLAGLLTEFAAEYPEFEVKIVQCEPKNAAKCAGDFDLYFCTLPLGSDLEHVPILYSDSYAVAFLSNLANRIYKERWPKVEADLLDKRELSLLREMPFILLQNRLHEVVLDQQIIFRKAGFTPNIAFQSENSGLNFNMCRLGVGVCVTTLSNCRCRFGGALGRDSDVLFYPIDTGGDPVIIALSHRKGKRLTRADNCFIKTAKRYMKRPVDGKENPVGL